MCGPSVVSIINLFSAYMRISKIAITYCYLYLTCMWLYLDVSRMKKNKKLISHYNNYYIPFGEFFFFLVCLVVFYEYISC